MINLFDEFALYFPSIARDAVSYHEDDNFVGMITVELDNGHIVEYDSWDHSLQTLSLNADIMTEEVCRYTFAYRLRKLLIRKRLTQLDLSNLTQIPRPQISNYITGKSTPSFYNLEKIARALDCSTDVFRLER